MAKKVSMPNIRKLLRLRYDVGLSLDKIAKTTPLSKGTVVNYLRLAEQAGLTWPLPEGLDDQALEKKLYPHPVGHSSELAPLDFPSIEKELRQKGVTLALLHEEYQQAHGPLFGYKYSAFCDKYRQWKKTQCVVMRQNHKAGDKGFVDYSGLRFPIHTMGSDKIRWAEIFVMTLGASSKTYAEATWTQQLNDWISSHIRAFEFFGGVPALLVPDCLKSAVTKADWYVSQNNATYDEMATHYDTTVFAARPRKPRDKGKVEAAVLLVQRWILARLRKRTFHSLAELNKAIQELLVELNNKPFKKMPGSIQELVEHLDKPALKRLPVKQYEFATWQKGFKVHRLDYHIQVDNHLYSVPYTLVGEKVDVRLSTSTVEILYKNKRVCSHVRIHEKGRKYSTHKAHMPKSHQKHLDWSPERFKNWATQFGDGTYKVVTHILENRPHPEHGFRSCMGLLSLAKKYDAKRLEAACARAIYIRTPNYQSVKSILKTGLDRQPLQTKETHFSLPLHPNVRGAEYFQ